MNKAIILLGIIGTANFLQAQEVGKSVELDIKNNDNFSGFEILDSSIMKARVIMTGENHLYVKFNSKMELKMLRYFNKKIGLCNFVIELGAARAHFLNRYIHDEKDSMAGQYLRATTSPRYMDLFNRLRKFNATLPDSSRINIYGIDVERFNDLPLMRLAELLPIADVPSEIRVGVEAIKNAADYMLKVGLREYEAARDESAGSRYSYNYEEVPFYITPTITEFIRYYDSLKPNFTAWLGDKFAGIDQAVTWLKEYKQWNDYDNTTFQYIWREENIYRNLSSLVTGNPGERFYGQFGRCHVAYEEQNGECGWYGYHSVINKMRSRYFHNADSVLTIGLFYTAGNDNSYYSDREDDKEIQAEIDALVGEAKAKTITLFHLKDGEASMPKLANKFSFAIVNRSVDMEEDDSVKSEIISWGDKSNNVFKPNQYFGYGYSYSTVSPAALGEHVASNGYSTELGIFGTHNFTYGISGDKMDHSFQFSFFPAIDLHATDSGLVQYSANQFHYRLGYQWMLKKRIQCDLGAQFGYGREKIKLTEEGTSFLATRKDKDFIRTSFFVGPSAGFRANFAKYFYVGLQASQLFDLSSLQWRFKGSSQGYGKSGEVSSGFSGTYISLNLGFFIETPEYESDISSE